MGLDSNAKVLICTGSHDDNLLFQNFLKIVGYTDIVCFDTIKASYEHATRNQKDLFITGFVLPDGPGVVLLQKLRETGNYGLETHLFVGDQVDRATLNLFFEHDVHYVLKHPYSEDRVVQKLQFMQKREDNLPPVETVFREAQTAFTGKIFDMAYFLMEEAEKEHGQQEKFEILKGKIRIEEENFEDAKVHFLKAAKINPNSVWAKSMLAKVYMKTDHFDEAKEILDELVVGNPNHLNVLENAGLSNFELGHYDLARSQLDQLKNIEPENKVAAKVTTQIRIEQGDIEHIAGDLMESHPEKEVVAMLNSAGIALSKENRLDDALQVYFDTLDVVQNPEYAAKVHYNIGLTMIRMNNYERAIKHLEEATHLLPGFEKAQQLMQKVQGKLAA